MLGSKISSSGDLRRQFLSILKIQTEGLLVLISDLWIKRVASKLQIEDWIQQCPFI